MNQVAICKRCQELEVEKPFTLPAPLDAIGDTLIKEHYRTAEDHSL